MKTLILLVPLLPLLGFLINGLGRRSLPRSVVSMIACGTVLGSFIISILLFFRLDELGDTAISGSAKIIGNPVFHYFDFINVDNLRIPFSFQIDQLSVLFLLIITGVGFLIHLYSSAWASP